jgi:hypothetical protein
MEVTAKDKRDYIRDHAKSLVGLAAMYRLALTTRDFKTLDSVYRLAVAAEEAMEAATDAVVQTGVTQKPQVQKKR